MSDPSGPSSGGDSQPPTMAPGNEQQRKQMCRPDEKGQFREWLIRGRGLFKELRSSQDDLQVCVCALCVFVVVVVGGGCLWGAGSEGGS